MSSSPRQLTFRAIATGCVIGALLTPCNVYSGLKIGWSFNMSIAAALLSYAFWQLAHYLFKTPYWDLLENNINQTAASSAASIISAGIVAPIPALAILTGRELSWAILSIWCFVVSFTGVVVAVGLRKQMLINDKLPFPAGMATAETVREIYAKGSEAFERVRVLVGSAILSGSIKLYSEFVAAVPKLPLSSLLPVGSASTRLGFVLDPSLLMIGFGGIIGLRAGLSLLFGTIVSWGLIGPWVLSKGWVHQAAGESSSYLFGTLVEWLLWPGVSMMVVAAITSFVLKVFFNKSKVNSDGDDEEEAEKSPAQLWPEYFALPEKEREVPRSWFWGGLVLAAIMATIAQVWLFGISPLIAILAVLLTFVLAIVSCRVSGETGIPPIGALGKVTQLTFGILNPGNLTANLMTANVTGGAAGQSSDLLHDMKTGLVIGATPRFQVIAQLFGIMAGALAGSAAYLILIPEPAKQLLTDKWPAPAVATWKAIAEVFKNGPEAIPTGSIPAMAIGALIGLAMSILEWKLPKRYSDYLPSPASFGLAFIIPAWNSISMFIGALLAYAFANSKPKVATKYLMVIAAGLVAGESLAGIFAAIAGFLGF